MQNLCILQQSAPIFTCILPAKHFDNTVPHRNALFFTSLGVRVIWNAIHFAYYVQLLRYGEWLFLRSLFDITVFSDVFYEVNEKCNYNINST